MGRECRLISRPSRASWGFIAKGQGEGISGWKARGWLGVKDGGFLLNGAWQTKGKRLRVKPHWEAGSVGREQRDKQFGEKALPLHYLPWKQVNMGISPQKNHRSETMLPSSLEPVMRTV